MFQIFNYTELKEENGKKYLFDSSLFSQRCRQIEEFQDIFNRLSSLLKVNGYKPSWAADIVRKGSDGLREKVKEDTAGRIASKDLPKAIARYWERLAVDDIPNEVLTVCDSLSREADQITDGLPIQETDIIISAEGVKLADSITEKVRQGCRLEVTEEMKVTAESILKIAKE